MAAKRRKSPRNCAEADVDGLRDLGTERGDTTSDEGEGEDDEMNGHATCMGDSC